MWRALAALLALAYPTLSAAQEDESPPTLTGSLVAGAWSGSRNLDDETGFGVGRFTAKINGRFAELASFAVEGRLWNQNFTRGEQHTHGELREAWAGLALGAATDIRLGKQLMTWGRADGINPTDLVNARDFTRMVPDDSDQKLGTWTLKATQYFGIVSLTGLWIVRFEPHRLPFAGLPPGVTITQDRPDDDYRQGAAKVDIVGEAMEAAFTYYDGFDHVADLRPSLDGLTLVYPRIRVVGVDAAKNLGRFGLRSEASYTFQDRKRSTAPLPRRRDVLYLVAGFDRSFFESLNINVQYIGRYLRGFTELAAIADESARSIARPRSLLIQQHRRHQHGMSLRVSDKWLHETLETEIRGLVWLAQGDFALSPKVSYAITDRLTVSAGGDYYHGPRNSLFGYFKKNQTAYVELKWGF
jgi:hypothetical protein